MKKSAPIFGFKLRPLLGALALLAIVTTDAAAKKNASYRCPKLVCDVTQRTSWPGLGCQYATPQSMSNERKTVDSCYYYSSGKLKMCRTQYDSSGNVTGIDLDNCHFK